MCILWIFFKQEEQFCKDENKGPHQEDVATYDINKMRSFGRLHFSPCGLFIE